MDELRDEFLSDEDLDLANLSWEELIACWNEWLRPGDHFVGLSDFGASAPAPKVYAHFGLTAERIADIGKEIKKTS